MINNCIIVLNYNDSKGTINFVDNVRDYINIDRIVIVDNYSTDDSFDVLSEYKSGKIDVIRTEGNKGYSYGNNFGIKYAIDKYNPKYVTISNPDVFIEDDTINKVISVLDKSEDVAMATASMLEKKNEKYELSKMKAWKCPDYGYLILSSLFICSKFADKMLMYDDEYFNSSHSYVDAVQGSFFIARAEAMKKINYMDERTFLYCEEIILGRRIKEENYRIVVLNDVTYNHDHGVTINKNIKNKINKFKILNESRDVYATGYLKYNAFKYMIFKIACKIGILERKLLYKLTSR